MQLFHYWNVLIRDSKSKLRWEQVALRKKGLVVCIIAVVIGMAIFLTVGANKKSERSTGYTMIKDEKLKDDVKLPYTNLTSYIATNDFIYVAVCEPGSASIANQIVKIDRTSGAYKSIFHSNLDKAATQGLKNSGDWIIWVDGDDLGGSTKFYAFNEKTNKTLSFGTTSDTVYTDFPEISGDLVVWAEHEQVTKQTKLMTYDLTTQKRKTIRTVSKDKWKVSDYTIRDGVIAYIDKSSEKMMLHVQDTKKKTNKKYPITAKNPDWLTFIDEHTIVYVDNLKQGHFDKNKLMTYNMKDKKESALFADQKTVEVDSLSGFKNDAILTEVNNALHVFAVENGVVTEQPFTQKNNWPLDSVDISYWNHEFYIFENDVDAHIYNLTIDTEL